MGPIDGVNVSSTYARDLDLNLLRVFVVVAEAGSVTEAARKLYLTQPAVSAAIKRLQRALEAPLFARQGRGVVLTARGERLLVAARPHLSALAASVGAQGKLDPRSSERTVRLGLSDVSEAWLLRPLLAVLAREAPRMRIIVVPVQFRTAAPAFSSGSIDCAITVADEMPAGVRRKTLFRGGFVCLHDPGSSGIGRALSRDEYFAREHVVVSYNGDLRGIVEDALGQMRRVRVSVPSFHGVGPLLDGSALLATVPALVAREIRATRPHLRIAKLPFELPGSPMELLWRSALDDDADVRFVMGHIERIAARAAKRAIR